MKEISIHLFLFFGKKPLMQQHFSGYRTMKHVTEGEETIRH